MLEVLKEGALNNGLINNYSIDEISLEIEPDKPSLLLVRFIDKEIYCALQTFTQHFEKVLEYYKETYSA